MQSQISQKIGIYDCVNLQELPENLGNLESLEELFLCGSAIKEIPDSICNLKNLVELSVETCANLLGLPANLGNLESLERLIADGTGIKELPESICNLKNLTELSVNECAYLQSLPENFGCKMDVVITLCKSSKRKKLVSVEPRNMWDIAFTIRGLQLNRLVLKSRSLKLRLEDVHLILKLQFLDPITRPDSELIKEIVKHISEKLNDGVPSDSYDKGLVGIDSRVKDAESLLCLESHLGNLKYVNLSFSKDLIRIPDLSGCPNLEGLPENIGNLESLKVLQAYGTGIKELPDSFGNLKQLTVVDISDCVVLHGLPESFGNLESLGRITASGSGIKRLPSLTGFPLLGVANLEFCGLLEFPSTICHIVSLKELYIGGNNLETIPDTIKKLSRLVQLELSDCMD
ncbi:hypothetical protein GH714_009025 [Hevea brasiliensis]|uniref:Disease resistance R13L4/SHOC-2-like LRR domain-containing protein n=1 Tax=Hevea brasiliensis TaxID=3981 RepID=A0A6A6KZ14_HEVBR|nr:hypothetical protein GH714_009025 [Hevea brasiliensis]